MEAYTFRDGEIFPGIEVVLVQGCGNHTPTGRAIVLGSGGRQGTVPISHKGNNSPEVNDGRVYSVYPQTQKKET